MKLTNAYKHLRVSYKRSKPPTCTCFGVYSGYTTKTLRTYANVK